MASRGRPFKSGLNREDVRRAYLLNAVAYLKETGKVKTTSHGCRIIANQMKDQEWDSHSKNTKRTLSAFLVDEHKNAKRSKSATVFADYAFNIVRLRAPNATRADAAGWLLNCLDYMDTN